jgi:hypothetical protein
MRDGVLKEKAGAFTLTSKIPPGKAAVAAASGWKLLGVEEEHVFPAPLRRDGGEPAESRLARSLVPLMVAP